MRILKAKIKKTSVHYKKGLNQKGKSIWLSITGFSVQGEFNYKIKAIKSIKNGFAQYEEIWVKGSDITLKQHEDGQLNLGLYSQEEEEVIKRSPRYFNQRRFEVVTENEKLFIQAPDFQTAQKIAIQYGLSNFRIQQVRRLTRKDLDK